MKIKSHSEREIFAACIGLMGSVYEAMLEYLELRDIDFSAEECLENCPILTFNTGEIVRRLFLAKTTHSGGTSTALKCKELGLKDHTMIVFDPPCDDEDDDD